MNPLIDLQRYGQSIWFNNIRRGLILSGELREMMERDGVRGVTSNPAVFEKAVASSTDYNDALRGLEQQRDMDAQSLYEALVISDVQDAADLLYPVYEQTHRRDGYVSLEVSPYLAHDTPRTIEEARRLWAAVGRENVMIQLPATPEGIAALVQLISEGINVNATLLFSVATYVQVAEAYLQGLEEFAAAGGDVSRVASVASFFLSRIDTAIDALALARLKAAGGASERVLLRSVIGKVAIAQAKIAYQRYKELYHGARWEKLAAQGAQTQRLLWAGTSTKNPNYRDTMYVEELIGADTVSVLSAVTLDAFRDHGRPRASLEERIEEAHDTVEVLEQVGISMKEVADKLLAGGVQLFADAFDKLLSAVERKRQALLGAALNRQSYRLPDDLAAAVQQSLEEWRVEGKVRRLWAGDRRLWTNADENKWLGWLHVTDDQLAHIDHLRRIAEEVKEWGFSHALLLGMGGSSLCPEVMAKTFGKIAGFPALHVLDSTDPAQVKAVEGEIDLANTLVIVSSKSGTTLESHILHQYFWERVKEVVGEEEVGHRFIAITDPGSPLQLVAERDRFRHVFFGLPSIGGRYSALSDFGMVPSAIIGVDVAKFLDRAEGMVHSCASCVPPEDNPGVVLGTILGTAHDGGRDKVTIVASPRIGAIGAWLEQLLAESTGKDGKGLIPVDGEELGPPEVYGDDRLFVYVRLEAAPDAAQDAAVEALEKAGQPVVRIALADPYELGEEFFRWEMATAVAGSLMGINPFDQPDVEASKVATRRLTDAYERTGALPPERPFFESDGIRLFADERNAAELKAIAGNDRTLAGYLRAHLNRLKAGDYFALLAYVAMNESHQALLQSIRHVIRNTHHVATCVGFGPRFLHSTGQAYKGGPNTGVFLQITCDDAHDLPVPGRQYTFGIVKAAQARGDLQVLAARGRRVLRVHLGTDVKAGLETLRGAIERG
ncbi:MAG: bifunctional transaldolase/phosoglucose isomerase [Abditibacteriales bacterium]|nr:bifunctional transaldolase/phosoglucose isomerase [Abditibacteriales bacterium]MDW8366239.1 bifunctional transaldolase/phosoglucose isomerase [Abditibacteriales bacterium]